MNRPSETLDCDPPRNVGDHGLPHLSVSRHWQETPSRSSTTRHPHYSSLDYSAECLLQRLTPEMACGGQERRPGPRLVGCPARSRALAVASLEIALLVLFLIFLGYRIAFSRHQGPLLELGALMVSTLVHLVTGLLLLHSARQGRGGLVWVWVWLRLVLVATDLAMVMVEWASGRDFIYATCILAFCVVSVTNIAAVRYFVIRV